MPEHFVRQFFLQLNVRVKLGDSVRDGFVDGDIFLKHRLVRFRLVKLGVLVLFLIPSTLRMVVLFLRLYALVSALFVQLGALSLHVHVEGLLLDDLELFLLLTREVRRGVAQVNQRNFLVMLAGDFLAQVGTET